MACPDCDRLLIAQRNGGAKCVSCDWQGSQEELQGPQEELNGTGDASNTGVTPEQVSVRESIEA